MANLTLNELDELKLLTQFNRDGLMSIEIKDECPETFNKVYSILDWQLEYNIKNKYKKHLDISFVHPGEFLNLATKINYFVAVSKGKIKSRLQVIENTERICIM